MSIINDGSLSADQLLLREKIIISDSINSLFKQNKILTQNIFDRIWNNSAGILPQQIFDSFGKDSAELLSIVQSFQDSVNNIVPDSLTQVPPDNFATNPDGTVLISQKVTPLPPQPAPQS